MSEDVKKEEVIDEGEVVEIETETQESESEEAEQPEEEVASSEEPQSDEDELENYSDRVQKRIKNLTRKLREAERASESAYSYATQLQQENQHLQQRSANLDRSYLSEAENRLKSQKAQAQAVLKGAYEEQDFDKVAKAQDVIAKIAVEESKIEASKSQLEYQDQQKAQNNEVNVSQSIPQQPVVSQPAPEVDPKAMSWAEKNTWFGDDETMTLAAFNIHRVLTEEEGFDPKSDEYYTEVDKRIREDFPHKFSEKKKPSQRVASAGRADTTAAPGKKQVRLSPSEVQMAKKLNVPLNEYAKFVKR
jgi:chromosome segregation ATPase